MPKLSITPSNLKNWELPEICLITGRRQGVQMYECLIGVKNLSAEGISSGAGQHVDLGALFRNLDKSQLQLRLPLTARGRSFRRWGTVLFMLWILVGFLTGGFGILPWFPTWATGLFIAAGVGIAAVGFFWFGPKFDIHAEHDKGTWVLVFPSVVAAMELANAASVDDQPRTPNDKQMFPGNQDGALDELEGGNG